MRINLGRADVFMPKLFLNSANICTSFQQVGRKTVSQAMAGSRLGNICRPHGLLYCALDVLLT